MFYVKNGFITVQHVVQALQDNYTLYLVTISNVVINVSIYGGVSTWNVLIQNYGLKHHFPCLKGALELRNYTLRN